MRRERSTLLGTPILIAPEAIRLLGDFNIPGEELSLFSAISSFATAQYFPRVQALSQIVASAVDQAKADLGEKAHALPTGSVLLTPTDSHAKKQPLSEEANTAITVATVAAIFETAGQTIEGRTEQILRVASDAYRQNFTRITAEGELAAAVYGGIVAVSNTIEASMTLFVPPMGLRLVIFETGHAIDRDAIVDALQKFAVDEPRSFAPFLRGLQENATRFAEDLAQGDSASAIASFGRYGQNLTAIAAATAMPITSEGLNQATLLAKELGGATKPSEIGNGNFGLALFPTPEAAQRFIRACQPPIVPLSFELERQGVRCQILEEPSAKDSQRTPKPDNLTLTYAPIVGSTVENEQTEENQAAFAEKSPKSVPSLTSTQLMVLGPLHHQTPADPSRVHETAPFEAVGLSSTPMEEEIVPARNFYHIPKKWKPVAVLAAIGLVVVVWASLPILTRPSEKLAPLPVQPLTTPTLPTATKPSVKSEPQLYIPKLVEKILDELPATSPDTIKPSTKVTEKAASRKKRLARAREPILSKPTVPETAAAPEPRTTSSPRAGKLSTDDF
jgi:hypothetical protein